MSGQNPSTLRLKGERGCKLLRFIHHPRPLGTLQDYAIILVVTEYFAAHYAEPITIPHLSHQLGISLLHIETAFDSCKGKTTSQALLEYRLNRLCDRMAKDPSHEIGAQIEACGLTSFLGTNTEFIEQFGIDLVEYHQQCFLAEAERLKRQDAQHNNPMEEGLLPEPNANRLLTRFHQYEAPLRTAQSITPEG
jgi:AraC-like DNA-binding protein